MAAKAQKANRDGYAHARDANEYQRLRDQASMWQRATEEVLDQIFAAKRLIGERVRARFFGVVVDGEVVSYADLYQDGADAQVEDVGTLDEHRGRGYARTVVLAAIEAARREGAEFVFLVADANDWPKELYGRLGFDTVGNYTKFFVPGGS